ncbi:hypothetical protein ACWD6K_32380 [Streptomyces sp. NPDC002431]
MTLSLDPAIAEALSFEIGHDAPFNKEELASVSELATKYVTDPSSIKYCKKLKIAILIGCDPFSLQALEGLEGLRFLTVQDSGLHDFRGVENLNLWKLQAPRNFVEDLTPLLDLESSCEIDVTGNPISPQSYSEVVPELSHRGHHIKLSEELPWKVTVRLHSEGVKVSCYQGRGGFRLCRPGLALTSSPDYSHPVISVDQTRELLTCPPHHAYSYFEREELMPRLLP